MRIAAPPCRTALNTASTPSPLSADPMTATFVFAKPSPSARACARPSGEGNSDPSTTAPDHSRKGITPFAYRVGGLQESALQAGLGRNDHQLRVHGVNSRKFSSWAFLVKGTAVEIPPSSELAGRAALRHSHYCVVPPTASASTSALRFDAQPAPQQPGSSPAASGASARTWRTPAPGAAQCGSCGTSPRDPHALRSRAWRSRSGEDRRR